MDTPADVTAFVQRRAGHYRNDPLALIQLLRDVQDRHGHVSPEAQHAIARVLSIPVGQVEGAVEFYAFLHTADQGRYALLFSDNITDEMLGNRALVERLCAALGVAPGETRGDGRVSVGYTSCTGMCDQGPAALVNGYALTGLDAERVDAIARLVEEAAPLDAWPPEFFAVEANILRRDLVLASDAPPADILGAVEARGAEGLLQALEDAGLRGMGGAGFRTATKWRVCRNTPGQERFVVCNADEGEPGTFKDRALLQDCPDLLFDGMTACARVIGARRGYLYLRGEYRVLLPMLQEVLAARRERGLLGEGILGVPGFDFEIDVHLGAGAYICGEESALIESLEGKRGVARVRPPFPVTHGYLHQPTVVNNVETFAAAALIALHGAEWYRGAGTADSPGTKMLSISGDCARPGIYEYPFGVTVAQVLEDCGAADTQAVQVAGAAGHLLGPEEFGRRIAFEDVATGGSFMVFDHSRDLYAMARNFAAFFAHESCGFCTPCRVGTSLVRDLVEKIARGQGSAVDVAEIRNLGRVMQDASQCGLGKTAPSALFDLLDKFPRVVEDRLESTAFEPAFDLDAALAEARAVTGRDDPGAHL